MKKYEYIKVTKSSSQLTDKELNDYGSYGWEMVGVSEGRTGYCTYYFKRELDEEQKKG